MLKKEGVTFEFDHIGMPTKEPQAGEYYSKKFDMFGADIEGSRLNAQWHRFGPDSCLHPLIQTFPHVAFKVNDIEKATAGENVIMPLHEPIPGFRSVMIEDAGLPVEFIETNLSYDEIIDRVNSGLSTCKDMDT